MNLVVLGMSHKTAPLGLRERFAVPSDRLADLLHALRDGAAVSEAMAVSTCNRVEVFAVPAGESAAALTHVRRVLVDGRGFSADLPEQHGYTFEGREAVHHLLRVTASLDSMVVGEPQILGQMKDAAREARQVGTVGPILGRMLDHGFATAKQVRTRTGIARSVVSVGSVAVDLAGRIFEDLAAVRVLIVGAGKMAEATARSLGRAGAGRVYVANRSRERGERLAERHGWLARGFDELGDLLAEVDIVITSTGSSEPILDVARMQRIVRARKYRPIFLVDIAVPRDVAPAVGKLDTVYLYNVDDLEEISRANLDGRQREAEAAERLVREGVDGLETWFRGLAVKPTLAAIRRRAEAVAASELERTLSRRLGHLSEADREALGAMQRATIAKLLHPTMDALRGRLANSGSSELLAAARLLHGVDEPANVQDSPQVADSEAERPPHVADDGEERPA